MEKLELKEQHIYEGWDVYLAITKALGITEPLNKLEIVFSGNDPMVINVSYYAADKTKEISKAVDMLVNEYTLVKK